MKTKTTNGGWLWIVVVMSVAVLVVGGLLLLFVAPPIIVSRDDGRGDAPAVIGGDADPGLGGQAPTDVPLATPRPKETFAAFVEQFNRANPDLAEKLALTGTSPANVPFAGGEAYDFDLNGRAVRVYVYEDDAERERLAAGLSEDGFSYAAPDGSAAMITWADIPHFWVYENYLIQYIGQDEDIIPALNNAFGVQIADGADFMTGAGPRPTAEGELPPPLAPVVDGVSRSLLGQDFDAARQWLAADFGYGLYRSEWTTVTPDEAVAQLATLWLPRAPISHVGLPDSASPLVDGQNPYAMLGPDREVVMVLHAQGLGEDGRGEGLLYFERAAGEVRWAAFLLAPEGFTPPGPPPGEGRLIYEKLGGGGLFRLEPDGGSTPLTPAAALLSPDATRAVYRLDDEPNRLAVFHTSNGFINTVDVGHRLVGCFVWQGDSHVLCGVRHADEEDSPNLGHLVRVFVETGAVTPIGDTILTTVPAVSPDGQTVAFDGDLTGAYFWDGAQVTRFDYAAYPGVPYQGQSPRIGSPSFAHDGRRMAWIMGDGATTDLVVFDFDTQTARSLFQFEPAGFGGWFPAAAWSIDDQWLALWVFATSEDVSGLYLISADGATVRRLGGRELSNAAWLDATRLAVTRYDPANAKDSRIVVFDVVAGTETELATPDGVRVVGVQR